jgi:hypothetical protein
MIEWKEACELIYTLEKQTAFVFRAFNYPDKKDELNEDVKKVFDDLYELNTLFIKKDCIDEWKINPVAFLDICNAFWEQIWIPYRNEYNLVREEILLTETFKKIHYNYVLDTKLDKIEEIEKDALSIKETGYGYTK